MSGRYPKGPALPGKDPAQKQSAGEKAGPFDNFTWPEYCTQMQIRYTCGHTTGGEFIKCFKHYYRDDERCANCNVQYVEAKQSPHKCRNCLHTPDS